MLIAVAGGSGFVGRHVLEALRSRGHQLLAVDRGRRPRPAGVDHVACDLAGQDPPPEALRGVAAVVNLVGIKRPAQGVGFVGAHVDATARLIAAARAAGVRRFVHVSVVCSRRDATLPYHDSKWKAEELVRRSGLRFTILRPGVIFGRGDDMVTHLVRMIRSAPVFPIVGRGDALLQPVHVEDVAAAVVAALERPRAVRRTYDVVGARALSLREVVETVARAAGLPLFIVPTPLALMRPVVTAWSALSAGALSTPSQLRMLQDGMTGDGEPARRDLGLEPRAFDEEAVRGLAPDIGPLWGLSVRLSPHAQPESPEQAAGTRGPWVVALTSLLLLPLLGRWIDNVWYRMALNAAVLVPLALVAVPLPWTRLFRPSLRLVAIGAAAAVLLYAAGAVVAHVLAAFPATAAQMAAVYGWRAAVPPAQALPLLLWIVLGEEIVWRTALTLSLAARWGAGRALILSALVFAGAHVSLDQPLLLGAALGAGAYWSAMVLRWRSAVPALVSHALWDVAVLFVWPYV
jgi:uncharacterized protein YbjT (DUF2867 family)/membrane protease YdiL (CAAX protease family)